MWQYGEPMNNFYANEEEREKILAEEERRLAEEQEYQEFLDECEKKYAKRYCEENLIEFIDYLSYSGYTHEEFLHEWSADLKQKTYELFFHESEDREEYIREKEGLL
jgi:hypothetical protein